MIYMPSGVETLMGFIRYHDFTNEGSGFNARLSRCYELVGKAVIEQIHAKSDEIRLVVHGSWHGPDAPTRINHTWLVLADETVWEPVTAGVYDPDAFYDYTRGMIQELYTPEEASLMMVAYGHFGPWQVSGNEERRDG